MKKSILAAAAFAALAMGAASGSANAASIGGGLGGVRAAAPELAQQVHWRPYHHNHRRWHKPKRKYVCTYRYGRKICHWRGRR